MTMYDAEKMRLALVEILGLSKVALLPGNEGIYDPVSACRRTIDICRDALSVEPPNRSWM